jgi:hypothetical protein
LRRCKFVFTALRARRTVTLSHHGQPEKETSTEDEQAQAQKALESESPQEAYVAEMSGRIRAASNSLPAFPNPSLDRDGFFIFDGALGFSH